MPTHYAHLDSNRILQNRMALAPWRGKRKRPLPPLKRGGVERVQNRWASPQLLAATRPRLRLAHRPLLENLLYLGYLKSPDWPKPLFRTRQQNIQAEDAFQSMYELCRQLHDFLPHVIDLVIDVIDVIDAEGYAGGTSSDQLGVIWINQRVVGTPVEWAEHVWALTQYQTLLAEDLVHGIFTDLRLMERPDYRVELDLPQGPMDFDQAFCAAGAAIGLTWFHGTLARLIDPWHFHLLARWQDYGRRCLNCLQEISLASAAANQPVLTEYGQELLDGWQSFFAQPDLRAVTAALSCFESDLHPSSLVLA